MQIQGMSVKKNHSVYKTDLEGLSFIRKQANCTKNCQGQGFSFWKLTQSRLGVLYECRLPIKGKFCNLDQTANQSHLFNKFIKLTKLVSHFGTENWEGSEKNTL